MTVKQEDSPTPRPSPLICPVGEARCSILNEVADLRYRLTELSNLVRTDTLTGIANYRYFVQSLEQEIERTQRSGQPTTLMMIDIDYFKKVNDQWGHEIGNQALIHISQLLQKTVRKLDIPCRYGGEEFAVILPNTNLGASLPVAERIRAVVEETPLDVDGEKLSMTISLGIATYFEQDEISVEELVREADRYLYEAKASGRNRVCHAPQPSIDIVTHEERQVLTDLFGRGATKDEE